MTIQNFARWRWIAMMVIHIMNIFNTAKLYLKYVGHILCYNYYIKSCFLSDLPHFLASLKLGVPSVFIFLTLQGLKS